MQGSSTKKHLWSFTRSATGGKSPEYMALNGHDAKLQFRKKWAEEQWKALPTSVTRSEDQSSSKMDIRKGLWYTYKDLKGMMSVKAAKRVKKSCLASGGEFVQTHPQSLETMYLFIRKELQTIDEQTFSLKRKKDLARKKKVQKPFQRGHPSLITTLILQEMEKGPSDEDDDDDDEEKAGSDGSKKVKKAGSDGKKGKKAGADGTKPKKAGSDGKPEEDSGKKKKVSPLLKLASFTQYEAANADAKDCQQEFNADKEKVSELIKFRAFNTDPAELKKKLSALELSQTIFEGAQQLRILEGVEQRLCKWTSLMRIMKGP
eukprot:590959-Amphidinium_carterae.1